MPRAVQVHEYCQPEGLRVEEVQVVDPKKGMIQVQVDAAAVNFPDFLMIQGKYQFKPPMPFAPGGELAGTVVKVGPGVTGFKVGDKVQALTGNGAFAQIVNVGAAQCLKVPNDIDLKLAAALMMTYGTTIHAFRQRVDLKEGETCLVLGASGGVGTAAVEIAKAMGATVIAAASSEEKLQVCKRLGADFTINYSKEDLREKVKEFTNGAGVDVIYDPVGDKYAEPAIRSLAWKGRYAVIGFAGGEIPKIPLNLLLLKGSAAVGVFWGAFTAREPQVHAENVQILFDWIRQGKIKPVVTQTYSLDEAGKALRDLADRKVIGKALILPNGSGNAKI